MPTLSERTGQLESDARDAKSSLDAVSLQAEDFAQFRQDSRASLAQLEVTVAVLKQRIDENVKRSERPEVSIEALLKDVAALKTSSGDLQKRVDFWESRIWGGGLAVIGALVSAVATLAYAILRK